MAFLWLPVPTDDIATRVLVRESRWVALPSGHRLGDRPEVPFASLLGEAFVALPAAAGALRDFWLALDARSGRPPLIAAEANVADEVLELVGAGVGIALIAEGNARLYERPGLTFRPVPDLPPAELAIAWRRDDPRDIIQLFIDCVGE